MRRLVLTLAAAAVLTIGAGSAALAGGWAVTTFDSLPPAFSAGETYALGYTIRQHGVAPVNVDRTEIVIWRDGSGDKHAFEGAREGPIGHYVARVTFPAAGEWNWQVTQGYFPSQSLGKLEIQPAAGAQREAPLARSPVAGAPLQSQPLQSQPLFAAAAGFFAAVFVWRAVALARLLRGTATAS
jgi:hypothetical protein